MVMVKEKIGKKPFHFNSQRYIPPLCYT